MAAREEIEYAEESRETTYFNEEAQAAREAVEEALREYEGLLRDVDDSQRGEIQRSNGLKMEQLKGELGLLLEAEH